MPILHASPEHPRVFKVGFLVGWGNRRHHGLLKDEDIKLIPNYPKDWHLHHDIPMMTQIMELYGCQEKTLASARPGDILTFKVGRGPSHLGILLEDNVFIHALYGGGKKEIVMSSLSAQWTNRLVQVFKFPGIK